MKPIKKCNKAIKAQETEWIAGQWSVDELIYRRMKAMARRNRVKITKLMLQRKLTRNSDMQDKGAN